LFIGLNRLETQMPTRASTSFVAAAALCFSAQMAWSDTLSDALVKAYQLSPILEASRASLRSTDEGVAQARAARRPTVSGSATAALSDNDDVNSEVTDTYSIQLTTSLTLLDGGQNRFAIESARNLVAAGRASLRDTEQSVLLNAVSAYMDVRRDMQFVSLSENNVMVLQEQVRAARDRFEVGEVTRTDVSLAEARLAQARANLASSQGQLRTSQEVYRAVIGVPPSNLQVPPPLPNMPASVSDAQAIALREAPSLTAAQFTEIAAGFDLKRAQAAQGFSASLSGSATYSANQRFDGDTQTSASVGVTGTLPLYQGGRLSSLVRQAQSIVALRKAEIQSTARSVRQNVATAWSSLDVSRATVAAAREEIRAAQVAFDGVREEATLGARTTLDVLDREQELRDAQFALASAERDRYVAGFNLLASMGLLSVDYLGLGIPTYDPDVNYQKVQNAPFSTERGTILDKLRGRYAPVK
ncbi:MAG: TolC family outer membrane protein, partial [Pseudomonadota bacterium]